MTDLNVHAVLICDDIRKEDNGKFILIGVYSAEILTEAFPANLRVYFWPIITASEVGQYEFDIRVMGPNEAQLVQGSATVVFMRPGMANGVSLGPVPLQIQAAGLLRLEMRNKGKDWHEIGRVGVALREPQA